MARILLNLDTKPFSPYRGGREGGLERHFMDEVMNPDDKKTQPMSKWWLYFRLLQILDSWIKIRVIWKVRRLGAENGQFRHNRASNVELGMKILPKGNNWVQSSFSTNFGGKLSFILCFLFPECLHCCYIEYFHCSYLYNYYNYSRTFCIKCWVSAFHTQIW